MERRKGEPLYYKNYQKILTTAFTITYYEIENLNPRTYRNTYKYYMHKPDTLNKSVYGGFATKMI